MDNLHVVDGGQKPEAPNRQPHETLAYVFREATIPCPGLSGFFIRQPSRDLVGRFGTQPTCPCSRPRAKDLPAKDRRSACERDTQWIADIPADLSVERRLCALPSPAGEEPVPVEPCQDGAARRARKN